MNNRSVIDQCEKKNFLKKNKNLNLTLSSSPVRLPLIQRRWMRTTFHRHRNILPNAQSPRRTVIAIFPAFTRPRALTNLRDDLLRRREWHTPSVVVHTVHTDTTPTWWSISGSNRRALAERPPTRAVAVFCAAAGSTGPALEGREDVAEEGPDEGDIGD